MPKRILIADDSELIRRLVRKILAADREIEICAEAENGVEAVQKVRKYHPDLVVMDVFMPEMSGLEAVQEIKKESPQLPIVMFTLSDSAEIQAESEHAGADFVLSKAHGGLDLLPTIRGLLCYF